MWGAVIGDIIGSRFESENHRSPYFELLTEQSRFTDDTVCTAAIADILEKNYPHNFTSEIISDELRLWCCTFLTRGFGSMFYQWIANGINKPYGSYGNGALMRISPVAKFAINKNLSLDEALLIAVKVTDVTHNHQQAIDSVKAYVSILYNLLSYSKNSELITSEKVKELISDSFERYKIPMPLKIEEYRVNADFDLTCYTSLAIACASILETDSFENVMYQVVSAGGDSDTYAAIAGAIAESIYGIPKEIEDKIKSYFREYDSDIVRAINKLYIK